MDNTDIISIYEAVSVITDQMVAAARVKDWEGLTALEARCAVQIELLRCNEPHAALRESERGKKVRIIKKILADDREIRNITAPWMEQLSMLINSTGTERKLSQAYGAGTTA